MKNPQILSDMKKISCFAKGRVWAGAGGGPDRTAFPVTGRASHHRFWPRPITAQSHPAMGTLLMA
jgi:hypothetical protein